MKLLACALEDTGRRRAITTTVILTILTPILLGCDADRKHYDFKEYKIGEIEIGSVLTIVPVELDVSAMIMPGSKEIIKANMRNRLVLKSSPTGSFVQHPLETADFNALSGVSDACRKSAILTIGHHAAKARPEGNGWQCLMNRCYIHHVYGPDQDWTNISIVADEKQCASDLDRMKSIVNSIRWHQQVDGRKTGS